MDAETSTIAELAGNAEFPVPKKTKKAKKPAPKKKAKPTAKPAGAKARKAKRPAPKKKAARSTRKRVLRAAKVMAAVARSERLDMRLTKAEKVKVHARAKKLRRTVTSIVIEAIEKIK